MSKASKVLNMISESSRVSGEDCRLLGTFFKLLLTLDFKSAEGYIKLFDKLGEAFRIRGISSIISTISKNLKNANSSIKKGDMKIPGGRSLSFLEDEIYPLEVLSRGLKVKDNLLDLDDFEKAMSSFQKAVIRLNKRDEGLSEFIKKYAVGMTYISY